MEEQAKQQTWWQKHTKLLIRTGLIALVIVVIVLIILIILGYIFNWDWTGLNATDFTSAPQKTTRIIVYEPGKTLWDWLGLLGVLAIPVVVGFGVAWFTAQQGKVSERENKDNQREKALQDYIDKMSELLLKEHLGERTADGKLNPEGERAAMIARVRTITVLTQLDGRRVGYVFAFLREARLMSTTSDDNILSLSNADFHAVNWSQGDLRSANLRKVNLSEADLSNANLRLASFSDADLSNANLSGANLDRAWLEGADLQETNLSKTNLTEANLRGAKMSKETDLSEAILEGAIYNNEPIQDESSQGGDYTIKSTQFPQAFDPLSTGLKCDNRKNSAIRASRLHKNH